MSLTKGPRCLADDFNRVILSMKRGQEHTDYINASFIDVSPVALAHSAWWGRGGFPDFWSTCCHSWKGWECQQRPQLFH